MKRIVAEYSLQLQSAELPGILSLFRFPVGISKLKPTLLRTKPQSKYTEISVKFPNQNISETRCNELKADGLTYKALPVAVDNYYYGVKRGDSICIYKISEIYLFEPVHIYYAVKPMRELGPRAENKEEVAHRKGSYVHKLKLTQKEEFRTYLYEEDMNYLRRVFAG